MNAEEKTQERAARRWRISPADESAVGRLAPLLGLSETVARILVSRGLTDEASARRFLEPDISRDWLDPSLIPGMDDAADRVADAVTNGRQITVFGDFDLDGISSAAAAARGLALLGAHVTATVPNRFTEGYGLTEPAVARLIALGTDLVVTVDCGISGADQVAVLQEAGIDVVVTDHHEPGEGVPDGVPVANPKLDSTCPSSDLAGAGVALKLVQAVGRRLGQPDAWLHVADLAMLGTIADIVPLQGENRALVAAGLGLARREPRAGIVALAAVAGVACDAMTAESVAFGLAPRLNAAGRMGDPGEALELLMTDDPASAEQLAALLDEHNRDRQRIEHDLSAAALEIARRTHEPGDRLVLVAGEGWHEGVKGIVASRLASLYEVPAIVFAIDGEFAQGSGRSTGSVDLHAAVSACADVAVRFGGHEKAVGVTVEVERLGEFHQRLNDYLADLPTSEFESETLLDGQIELDSVSVELAAEIEQLAPFGNANPRPRFVSRGVFMNGREKVGKMGNHLRFTAFDGTVSVPAIAFRCRDIESMLDNASAVDLAYEINADEWRGRKRVQLRVQDFEIHRSSSYEPAAELVEDLFDHADEILAREAYAGIEDAESFYTKLAGVTFEGRQDCIRRLVPGAPLRLERQPHNEYDENAIALFDAHGDQVGFFNRRLASALAPIVDAGVEYDVEVADVTGGDAGRSSGVNVLVSRRGADDETDVAQLRAERRAELAGMPPDQLTDALVSHFIGERELHDAQRQSLDALGRGERCLTVMATGRGKSLIFHVHAARTAVSGTGASVLVFPLRALVADQSFHLEESLSRVGVSVRTLTGESSPAGRDEVFAGLSTGTVDIVLTTPEFLEFHSGRFAETGAVEFVVIDEAHHVAASRAGHRPSYSRLGRAIDDIGSPAVLAVTATAGDDVANVIEQTLSVTTVVADPTVRENLMVEDRRGIVDKDGYLAALVARREKAIVYVNSREQSVRLARMLRKRVPEIAMRVAFYNGGLGRSARHAVERAFRAGEIDVVIATSAFGEGVNIPDIRHVVLYHLPFNDIEFNQMCGRVGRDGAAARIHPLFGSKDGKINEMILASVAPERDDMAALYVVLRDLAAAEAEGLEITNAELAERVAQARPRTAMNERGVSSAIGVFRELGFVESDGYGAYRRLTLLPAPGDKVDLASSVRYAEGLEEVAEFRSFREWVLGAAADELLARVNRPILPSTGT